MSRFRTSNNGCASPPPQPTATCHDQAALGVAAPGREFQGSLDHGRPVLPLIATGRYEMMVPDAGTVPLRFVPRQAGDPQPDPFLVGVVAQVEVPSGYQGSHCRITTSVGHALLGQLVRFALYAGRKRIQQWSGAINQPLDLPLQHRDAAGARSFSIRAALAPEALPGGDTPIRTQVVVYGTLELTALGDSPLGVPCCDKPNGGRRR